MCKMSDDPTIFAPLLKNPFPLALIFVVIAMTVAMLHLEGRIWWCPAGDLSLWSWSIWSQHNSQHVIDPYSFTHMLHGMLEFWFITLLFKRVPIAWRLFIAVLIESSWELGENSDFVIERYRAVTISLAYFGDSIINSVSDITCCSGGFLLACKLGFWRTLAGFFATEAILIWWIHDSLLINILMLIYPIEAVRTWQIAA
jgi:Protein of unknown function (DUF2585)